MLRVFAIFLLLSLPCTVVGQNPDSLLAVWKDANRADSVRLEALHRYGRSFLYSRPDTTLRYAQMELEYSLANGDAGWQAKAWNLLGGARWIKSDFAGALDAFQRSFELRSLQGHRAGMSEALNNIGNIYYMMGDFEKTLRYYMRSLDLDEKADHASGIADSYLNISTVYANLEKFEEALSYMEKALVHYRQERDTPGIATAYNNMGNVHRSQGRLEVALKKYRTSYRLLSRLDHLSEAAFALSNIGNIYTVMQMPDSAMIYYRRSLALRQNVGDRRGQVAVYNSMGEAFRERGQIRRAEQYCLQALEGAEELSAMSEALAASRCLFAVYKELGYSERALYYYEKAAGLEDSIGKTETDRLIDRMGFEKQVLADSLKRAEEKALLEAAHRQEVLRVKHRRNLFLFGGIGLLLLALGLAGRVRYMRRAKERISFEKERSDQLLLNILPAEVAEELKEKGEAVAREFSEVTVLFSDFAGFTEVAGEMSPQDLVNELNTCFRAFDEIVEKYGIEKIKTIGDAYMAAGGLPVSRPDSAAHAVRAALEMQRFMINRKSELQAAGRPAFDMRIGLHTGTVVAGIVGRKKFQYDIWGDAVNVASRMETAGTAGKVNLSKATYERVGEVEGLIFEPRGPVNVKGKGEMEMYFAH